MLNYLPDDEYDYILKKSFLGVVTLDVGMEKYSIPSKTFTYMHYGLPVLNFSTQISEISKLINSENIGHNYTDINAFLFFLSLIKKNPVFYNKLKSNCIQIANKNFSVNNASLFYNYIFEN